ncbi:DinB family protein [Aquirufa ecclesiirivi]
MITEDVLTLFTRDLNRLKTEISQYQDEANLWKVDGAVSNSAGNICLHLTGNLQTYFGSVYGNTGYVRDREKEFSDKAVPREQLLIMIAETEAMLKRVLPTISQDQLEEDYPMPVFDHSMKSGYYFIHLAVHLGYHLGQINYHRRLLDK